MIAVAAPDDRAIVRTTLGYAWELAMHVHAEGWHAGTGLLLDHLVGRIGLWHQGGIRRWWS